MIRDPEQYDNQTYEVHALKYKQSDWRFEGSFDGDQKYRYCLGHCQRRLGSNEKERTHVARTSKFAMKMSCTTIAAMDRRNRATAG